MEVGDGKVTGWPGDRVRGRAGGEEEMAEGGRRDNRDLREPLLLL